MTDESGPKPTTNLKWQRFANYSIKTKLVLFTMFATVTSLILALTSIISLDRMLTKSNMVEEVTAVSQVLAVRSEVALNFGDKRSSQSNLDALKNSPEYGLACIYGRNSELFGYYPKIEIDAKEVNGCPDKPPETLENFEAITSHYIHQWTQIHRNGQEKIGTLYIRRSLSSLNERLTRFALASAIITLIVLTVAYFIIARLQRVISRPILDLSSISVKIAQDNDYQRRAKIIGEDEIGTLGHAFNTMLDTIEKAQKELRFMAFYDALTGLPNRRYFMETLERQMTSVSRGYRSIALFLIDLDGFKGVNDTIGHDAGDMVLTTVSERMPEILRKSDMVARLGGDEFTIIISDISTPETIRKIALNIIEAIEQPIEFKGHRADVSASIGIAIAPSDGTSMDVVLKLADAAMYRAKAGGKKTFYFYDEEIDLRMKAFGNIESSIEYQLIQHKTSLLYQPIMSFNSTDPEGFIVVFDLNLPKSMDDYSQNHIAIIRHLSDERAADIMISTLIKHMQQDLETLIATKTSWPRLKFIIPMSNRHLREEPHLSKLTSLQKQFDINMIDLYFAVDRGGFDDRLSDHFKDRLVLSDDGNGIENLGAIDDIQCQCLASIPSQPLSEWEQLAWKNLITSANIQESQVIGCSINTPEQLAFAKALGLQATAGTQVSAPLQIQDIPTWLDHNTLSQGSSTP